jgi:hypothetical protein
LYHFIPILGDTNSDEFVDIKDLASTVKSYNAKKGSTDFSLAKDFNFDNIINLYDLAIVSRRLGS